MKPEEGLSVGHIVQIDPEHDKRFGGCFMVATEPKPWGAQGYVEVPGGRQAFYRCEWNDMELVGHATWIRNGGDESSREPD